MRVALRPLVAALLFVACPVIVDAAPVTLRLSGEIDGVWWDDDPEAGWTDLSDIQRGMPWELLVTYDSDAAGGPRWRSSEDPEAWGASWRYGHAVTAAFVVGPFSYTATGGDIATNSGLPYDLGADQWIVGYGQVQFEFNPGLWNGPTGNPAIWEGNMIVSYNDNGALYGDLPEFLDFASFQGLQSHLLWERVPAAGGGGQFFSAHGQITVDQIAAVPEPATLRLLGGGGMVVLIARKVRGRR